MTENTKSTVPTFTKPLSPYAFALATGKRPQMVYNYVSNKLIRGVYKDAESGDKRIPVAEMERWASKWAKKAAEKAAE